MLPHGFSIDMMVELVNAGLATTTVERVVAGGQPIEARVCGSPRRGAGDEHSQSVRGAVAAVSGVEGKEQHGNPNKPAA